MFLNHQNVPELDFTVIHKHGILNPSEDLLRLTPGCHLDDSLHRYLKGSIKFSEELSVLKPGPLRSMSTS